MDELADETVDLRVEKFAVMVRVKRERMRARADRFGDDHDARVVMRWHSRAVARVRVPLVLVDAPVIEFSEDDFIRNMGRFRAYVRVIVDPPEFVPRDFRVDPRVNIVRFPIPTNVVAF